MKAAGIMRRIDDLGRVVIPKEIRTALRIRMGNQLEIFTDNEGGVIFKKYSPLAELSNFCQEYTESLYQAIGHIAVISDKDTIIAVSGVKAKELLGKAISEDLEGVIDAREKVVSNRSIDPHFYAITADADDDEYTAQVISPIYAEGDTIGSVILLSKDENVRMGLTELKMVETAAGFFEKQMEQ